MNAYIKYNIYVEKNIYILFFSCISEYNRDKIMTNHFGTGAAGNYFSTLHSTNFLTGI